MSGMKCRTSAYLQSDQLPRQVNITVSTAWVLSEYCPSTARVLAEWVLLEYCPGAARVLPGCCPSTARVLPEYCPSTVGIRRFAPGNVSGDLLYNILCTCIMFAVKNLFWSSCTNQHAKKQIRPTRACYRRANEGNHWVKLSSYTVEYSRHVTPVTYVT